MAKKTKKIFKVDGEDAIKVSVPTVVYSFLIIIIVLTGVGAILAYGTNTQLGKKIAAQISQVLPFPAAIIGWNNVVYLDELESNVASVVRYYQVGKFSDEGLRVDFSTEAGRKRLEIKKREILDKMVEDKIIIVLAKERGIKISNEQLDQVVENKLNEYGTSEQVKDDLLNSYGWSITDFKKRVILPNLYAEALAEKIAIELQDNKIAKDKIENAKREIENGMEFKEVASRYSDGNSKKSDGELGWVRKDQILPELADVLFTSQEMKKNTIIESSIGYHIIEIIEKKKEEGEDVLKLRQIFVSKNTFADWLEKEKKQMEVWVPVNGFEWDSESGSVKFQDKKMNDFETEQREMMQGDASLIY